MATTPVTVTPAPESNTFKAIVRTVMPAIYSGVAAVIAHFGYHVSNAVVIQIVSIGFGGLTLVLHAAEAKWPWVGVFLGYIGAPVYTPSTKTTVALLQSQLATALAQLEESKTPSTSSAPVTPAPAPVTSGGTSDVPSADHPTVVS
jgi:hypothetical protein